MPDVGRAVAGATVTGATGDAGAAEALACGLADAAMEPPTNGPMDGAASEIDGAGGDGITADCGDAALAAEAAVAAVDAGPGRPPQPMTTAAVSSRAGTRRIVPGWMATIVLPWPAPGVPDDETVAGRGSRSRRSR